MVSLPPLSSLSLETLAWSLQIREESVKGLLGTTVTVLQ